LQPRRASWDPPQLIAYRPPTNAVVKSLAFIILRPVIFLLQTESKITDNAGLSVQRVRPNRDPTF